MSLALLNGDDNTLLWAGIGNVEGVLVRKHPHSSPSRERILLRAGVVGYQLLQPRASLVPVSPGDVMVLATDGIYPGFAEEFIDVHSDIQKVASRLLQQYRTQKDDALVLVARYLGTLG
jgi:serine/threonine protein phosphatase PrpC